jgi:hypothetical protein
MALPTSITVLPTSPTASPSDATAAHIESPDDQHRWRIRFASCWILAVLILFSIAMILTPSGGSSPELSIAGTTYKLPELCQFKRTFGIDCPGCGFTRSFVYIARFRISDAWSVQPIGTILAIVLAASIPYRVYQIARVHHGYKLHSTMKLEVYTIAVIAVLAYGRWLWRFI